jgi:hypothetical protein
MACNFRGARPTSGSVANGVLWAIGARAHRAGKVIQRWNGSGWQRMPDGALRIAVDPAGAAWIVGRRPRHPTLERLGVGDDAGRGGRHRDRAPRDGVVARRGRGLAVDGHHLDRDRPVRAPPSRSAPTARPWVVNEGGQIYRRAADGSRWELLPGAAFGRRGGGRRHRVRHRQRRGKRVPLRRHAVGSWILPGAAAPASPPEPRGWWWWRPRREAFLPRERRPVPPAGVQAPAPSAWW